MQTPSAEAWLDDLAALVAVADAAHGPDAARAAHEAHWRSFWGRSWIAVNASSSDAGGGDGTRVSSVYNITRYVHAVQSRNTAWPIKFNGMAFTAAMDDGKGAAFWRDWGPSNWWPNTRLPYGAMLAAGVFEEMEVWCCATLQTWRCS